VSFAAAHMRLVTMRRCMHTRPIVPNATLGDVTARSPKTTSSQSRRCDSCSEKLAYVDPRGEAHAQVSQGDGGVVLVAICSTNHKLTSNIYSATCAASLSSLVARVEV
jgi:hypothetical protein